MDARWAAAFALCLALGGCVNFAPAPITPERTMRLFEQRTLDGAGVQKYVASRLADGTAAGQVMTWDVRTLTWAAFYFSPELDLVRAKSESTAAAVQTASQHPNPTLQLPFEVTSNPKPGESPYTLGLGLDIPIETAGKRGYRIAQAQQLSLAAQFEVGDAAWQVRSRLRSELLDLFAARRRSRLLDEQVRARQEVLQMLAKRLAAGAMSEPEVDQARATLMLDRQEFAKANQQAFDALAGAAAVIGLPVHALEGVNVRLDAFDSDPPDLPDEAAREHALLNRADLQGALADYEASQAALQLEIANQYPDIHLGPGYTFDAGAHKYGLSLSGITLPLFNRNQGPIAEATARRKEAQVHVEALQAQAIGQVDRAAGHLRAALTARRQSESLEAIQERQLAAARKAFAVGEADRLSVVLAEVEVNSAALAKEDALAQVQRAVGELEDAMQVPLPASPTSTR